MKRYLVYATIIFIISSCGSEKSTDNNTIAANTDSITIGNTDTSTSKNPDSIIETDLNRIGDLSLGMNLTTTIEKIGQPDSKSKTERWDADGWFHQDWEYKSKGISLNMNSEKDASLMEIFSITITSPCHFKTNKNIGLGSTYNEVMTAYDKDIDKTASDESVVTVGSVYGGIIIEFINKKATRIFVGAAAE